MMKNMLRQAVSFGKQLQEIALLHLEETAEKNIFQVQKLAAIILNDVEGPESCNSYNMLKLTEDLFRANPSAKYMDYYERTLYNHILINAKSGNMAGMFILLRSSAFI